MSRFFLPFVTYPGKNILMKTSKNEHTTNPSAEKGHGQNARFVAKFRNCDLEILSCICRKDESKNL